MCTFERVAEALEKVCPRYYACAYKSKGDWCLANRGGDCYSRFLAASRHVDEGRACQVH